MASDDGRCGRNKCSATLLDVRRRTQQQEKRQAQTKRLLIIDMKSNEAVPHSVSGEQSRNASWQLWLVTWGCCIILQSSLQRRALAHWHSGLSVLAVVVVVVVNVSTNSLHNAVRRRLRCCQ